MHKRLRIKQFAFIYSRQVCKPLRQNWSYEPEVKSCKITNKFPPVDYRDHERDDIELIWLYFAPTFEERFKLGPAADQKKIAVDRVSSNFLPTYSKPTWVRYNFFI